MGHSCAAGALLQLLAGPAGGAACCGHHAGAGLLCGHNSCSHADALPPGVQDTDSWAQIKNVDWCKLNVQLPATHWCSYSCYLSSFAPAGSWAGHMCWLSAQPSGAPGSQCSPVDIGSMYGSVFGGPTP